MFTIRRLSNDSTVSNSWIYEEGSPVYEAYYGVATHLWAGDILGYALGSVDNVTLADKMTLLNQTFYEITNQLVLSNREHSALNKRITNLRDTLNQAPKKVRKVEPLEFYNSDLAEKFCKAYPCIKLSNEQEFLTKVCEERFIKLELI